MTDSNIEGNSVTLTTDTIQPSESISFTIKAKVKDWSTSELSKVVTNKATVTDISTGTSLDTNEVSTTIFKGDLHFEKVADIENNSLVKPGDIITYTIKYINKGKGSINDISIEDSIPSGTSLIDAGGATQVDDKLTWNGLSLQAGEEKSISFKVKVNDLTEDNLEGTITNTAKVNNQDTNTITHFIKLPKLEQSKEVDKVDNTLEGDTLTYTIHYSNVGVGSMDEFKITDLIPKGTTYVDGSASNDGIFDKNSNTITWTVKDLEASNEGEVTFKVTVDNLKEGSSQEEIINIAKVNNNATNEVKTLVTKKPLVNESSSTLPKTGVIQLGILALSGALVLSVGLLFVFLKYDKNRNK